MTNDELKGILTEVFSRTWIDTVLDVATLLLTLASISVAIWVAIIYKNQSSIFKAQKEINEIQLQMYKEELLAKKLSLLPVFIISCRVNGQNGTYELKEVDVNILRDSPVRYFNSLKLEVSDKILDLKSTSISGEIRYRWTGNINLKLNENQGNYSNELILKMVTMNLDEFKEIYPLVIAKNINGFSGDLSKNEGSLELVEKEKR